MKRSCLLLTAVFCLLLPAAHGQTDWPNFGNDPGGMRYSPLDQINTGNVTDLKLAWTYETEAPITREAPRPAFRRPPRPVESAGANAAPITPPPPRRPRGPRARISDSTPLVINDVMYVSTGYNRVLALVPETGKKIWEYELAHTPAGRGLSYWPGDDEVGPRLVIATSDGYLIEIDPKTGQPVPGFGKDGTVNTRDVLPKDVEIRFYGYSSPPAIYKNLIVTGGRSGERPERGAPGDIHAWNARTGELAWTFHTVPRPGEPHHEDWKDGEWENRAGANAWGLITVDVEHEMVFVPLGTPNLDFNGNARHGSNLYGSSLVALDANTGKLKWFFQTTHHDNWDYDLEAPPALIFVERGGKKIPAVAQMTKQDLLFIFNRLTGEPIYPVEERPVISDNTVPGDDPWPTQPFPVKPPPLGRVAFSPDDVAKVTPEHEAFCKSLLEAEGGVLTGGPYAQYGPKMRVIFPGWTGGGNWPGVAFDPNLGYIFTNVKNLGMYNKLVKREDGTWSRVGPDERIPNSSTDFWDTAKHWPCQAPPWGELSAVNANTGDIVWKVPLGVHPELELIGVPKTGRINIGGPIVTAGGVLFIGASTDGYFRAFDSRTGEELWATKLSASAHSVPITYQGKDGKQYVAVMASGGHSGSPARPGVLHVFSLP